jgi:hypothetical protein
MAYRLEREKANIIEVEVGEETLKIPVKGMGAYRKVLEAQGRLKDIQTKIELMSRENTEVTKELVEFLGESVIYLFSVAFGEENAKKILDFYEGNYDEMLLKVYPFFKDVYLPALKNSAKEDSREYTKRLTGAS